MRFTTGARRKKYAVSPAAVSYTHLDVYKRQLINHSELFRILLRPGAKHKKGRFHFIVIQCVQNLFNVVRSPSAVYCQRDFTIFIIGAINRQFDRRGARCVQRCRTPCAVPVSYTHLDVYKRQEALILCKILSYTAPPYKAVRQINTAAAAMQRNTKSQARPPL